MARRMESCLSQGVTQRSTSRGTTWPPRYALRHRESPNSLKHLEMLYKSQLQIGAKEKTMSSPFKRIFWISLALTAGSALAVGQKQSPQEAIAEVFFAENQSQVEKHLLASTRQALVQVPPQV